MSEATMAPLADGGVSKEAASNVQTNAKGGNISINTETLTKAQADEAAKAAAAKAGDGKTAEENKGKAGEIPPKPEGGLDKYYDPKTGAYNYEAHLREDAFRKAQAEKKAGAKKGDEANEGDDAAKAAAEAAGLDFGELHEKLNVVGDLDPEDYAALKKIGIPEQVVKDYVQVYHVAAAAVQKEALDYVGGEGARDELVAWASQNLPQNEIDKYNSMLASPDWKIAVDAIRARRATSGRAGHEPQTRINGQHATVTVGEAFKSFDEQVKAQQDPRYRTDPAYRAEVMQKIARSTYQVPQR